jgi:menaquinone-dependent protoporphyrinogen oxidase
MKILVAYASVHGSTGEVAGFMGRMLRAYSVEVDVKNIKDVENIADYDACVLGSAIHGGLWLREMSVFTRRSSDRLAQKPCYFWVTCIRALEEDGLEYALTNYFDHQILEVIHARNIAVFTGKLRTDAITRQELWYLASHYDGTQVPGIIKDDFRDWEAIAAWTNGIAKDLHLKPVFEQMEAQAVE